MNKKKQKIAPRYGSTYERLISEDPAFKRDLEKRCKKMARAELVLAIYYEDYDAVKKLAKDAGIAPALVRSLAGKQKKGLTLKAFSRMIDALGYDVLLKKRGKRVTEDDVLETVSQEKFASMWPEK